MDKPLISVIIPVYKVEKYLDRCINSVVNQTYQNLEIILVDDGSPDHCPEMCESWAKKDRRIKVIHKENDGLSSARNAGIDICKGEYISFVDSDDWIEHDMYERLYGIIVEYNVLLAMGGRYDVYENCLTDKKRFTYGERTLLSTEQLLPKMLLGQGCDSSACDKLYHRSLWEDIRFPEGEIYEDIAIQYKLVIEAKKIAVCDEPLYNYYHRSGSIVKSQFTLAYLDYPKHTRKIMEEITQLYPDLKKYASYSHICALMTVLRKLSCTEDCYFKRYRNVYYSHAQELKLYKDTVKENKQWFSLKRRILFYSFIYPPLFLLLRIRNLFKKKH